MKEHVKLKVYRAVVQATLLYAFETWAARSSAVRVVDVFQMQGLIRFIGTSNMQHDDNAEILKRASMVKFRRLRWIFFNPHDISNLPGDVLGGTWTARACQEPL